MIRSVTFVSVLLVMAMPTPAHADGRSKVAREAAEYVIARFGGKAAQEGTEALSTRIAAAAARHGDDAYSAVRRVRPKALTLADEAGGARAQGAQPPVPARGRRGGLGHPAAEGC